MRSRIAARTLVSVLVVSFAASGVALAQAPAPAPKPSRTPDVIFVPTPPEVVKGMLELAKVPKDDLVYDLGCGDGGIVVAAARDFGARGVGVDIDPVRIKEANDNVTKNKVGDKVKIIQADLFEFDVKPATRRHALPAAVAQRQAETDTVARSEGGHAHRLQLVRDDRLEARPDDRRRRTHGLSLDDQARAQGPK